jgi:N-acetylmuramic acid 6-phosphate etherase
MDFVKITESTSNYSDIDKMSVTEIIQYINQEDKKVAIAVEDALPQIENLITAASERLLSGGRLFYIGAGTSGRLGVLDASECVPTFGVAPDLVTGIIAGGDIALRNPVEFAEDDIEKGWNDLLQHNISNQDVLIGLTASGTTPYVLAALQKSRDTGLLTGSISCNPGCPISKIAEFPIEIIVGPEFITGSTRMKSGTAQKMVLNMISSSFMIKLGRIEGNKMVNMKLSNEKLINRGIKMVMESLNLDEAEIAASMLKKYGSVKNVINSQGK